MISGYLSSLLVRPLLLTLNAPTKSTVTMNEVDHFEHLRQSVPPLSLLSSLSSSSPPPPGAILVVWYCTSMVLNGVSSVGQVNGSVIVISVVIIVVTIVIIVTIAIVRRTLAFRHDRHLCRPPPWDPPLTHAMPVSPVIGHPECPVKALAIVGRFRHEGAGLHPDDAHPPPPLSTLFFCNCNQVGVMTAKMGTCFGRRNNPPFSINLSKCCWYLHSLPNQKYTDHGLSFSLYASSMDEMIASRSMVCPGLVVCKSLCKLWGRKKLLKDR